MSTTKKSYKKQTYFGSKIKISIIIPSFRSEKTIGRCLESLVNQDYHKKFYEIIVVDNFSKDNTEKICRKFKKVKFIKRKSNPAEARNLGAKMARGKIILFTDSDCVVPRNLLKKVMRNFRIYKIAGVGGTYKTLNKDSAIAKYVGYEIGWRHYKQPKKTDFLGTYCCAYKRDIFLKFGGFDETFKIASGEDPEFSFKLVNAGYKLFFDKTMFVWHSHPETLKRYLRQQFWRAYWRVNLYKKHPEKMSGDIYTGLEIPYSPVFMTIFIFSLLLSIFYPNIIYLTLLSIIIFFGIYLNFFMFISKSEKSLLLISLGVVFLRTLVWLFGFAYGLKLL